MYIIAGLGNPGREYENTRHNAGFASLDALAKRHGIELTTRKFQALTGSGYIDGQKVLLVKPQTYMNLSGESLRAACDFFKVDPEDGLIVIYDDIDIPTGTIRLRKKGSAGTHNGMRNIVYLLGDDGFPRIRVGIGRTDGKQPDLIHYVTSGVSKEEVAPLEEALTKAAESAACIVEHGIEKAMNAYNTKAKKPKRDSEAEKTVSLGADARTAEGR